MDGDRGGRHAIGPLRIAIGAAVGAAAGYVLHNESSRAWKCLLARRECQRRQALQYLRDNGPEMGEEERAQWVEAIRQRYGSPPPPPA